MRRSVRVLVPLAGVVAALLLAATVHGQSLEDRIDRAHGTVRFSYQPKPGVCGDGAATIYIENERGGQRVQMRSGSGGTWNYSSRYSDEWIRSCEPGPVRVALTVDQGRVTSLRAYVGGEWRPRESTSDFGRIDPRDAANLLMGIAERSNTSSVGNDAIFAATLADAEIWRRLLRMARNSNTDRNLRKQAVFWLGQEAAQAATTGLREIIDSDEEIEVREHAIFALSQRPNEESVPALIALVRRNNVDPRLKKRALFWLGQKDDPRAIALFEEILIRG
ncbi:MAG: HEAT repeat domain-containing protein [Longimicrobiales bacterium]